MSTNQTGQIARPAPTPLSRIEGQYRSALAQRWLSLVGRSAVFSTGVIAIILSQRTGGSLHAITASIIAGIAAYPLAVYPILSARRSIVVAPATSPLRSSLFSLLSSSLTSSQGLRYLSAHLSSSAVLCALYAIVLNIFTPTTELGCLASTPRHPLHLNERFIFLLLGNAGMMVLLGMWDLLGRRLATYWPKSNMPLHRAVTDGLMASIPIPGAMNSVILPTVWLGGYSLVYFALRKTVWIFLLTHSFGMLRPFIINFIKPSLALGPTIITHMFVLQLLTMLAARLPPIHAMTPYMTLPLDFTALSRKSPLSPEQYIVTALRSKDQYYLHFTFMELIRISESPSRRQALFTSTSKSQPPILSIWEDLLLHLGRTHQRLITRGGARPAAAPAPRAAPVKDARSVQIRQANIFRPAAPPKASGIVPVIQAALEGPVQPTPPAIFSKAQNVALDVKGKAEMKAVEWRGEVMGRMEQNQMGGTVLSEARGVWAKIGEWVGSEWAARYVGGSVPQVMVIERIMEIFALLACASLEEDTYGYVQQVLPATLEIIVRHRSALLSLQSELLMNAAALTRGEERAKREIQARIGGPVEACEQCVRRISDAFGESLSAFRFPPAVGSALADICQVSTETQPS